MQHERKTVALTHDDGTTSIMQLFADVDISAEVVKSVFASPVASWREVTPQEAAQIRAARPKPAKRVSVPQDASTAELEAKVRELASHLLAITESHDAMVSRVAEIERVAIADVSMIEGGR